VFDLCRAGEPKLHWPYELDTRSALCWCKKRTQQLLQARRLRWIKSTLGG